MYQELDFSIEAMYSGTSKQRTHFGPAILSYRDIILSLEVKGAIGSGKFKCVLY